MSRTCTRERCCMQSPDGCPSGHCPDTCHRLCEYGRISRTQTNLNSLKLFEREYPKVVAAVPSDPLLYQYRNFSGFWSILESNSLWASNARFSNDYAEQQQGYKALNQWLEKVCRHSEKKEEAQALEIEDCYIICFCRQGDTLSQWRGYTSDGGVAIGFDLSNVRPFSIIGKEDDSSAHGASKLSANVKKYSYYNACCSVMYVDPENEEEPVEKIRDYAHLASVSTFLDKAQTQMPFIKHHGFWEEQEYRFVFVNIKRQLHDAIRYREGEGIRIPYIIVKAGDDAHARLPSVVRIVEDDAVNAWHLVENLNDRLRTTGSKAIACLQYLQDNKISVADCRGCTIRHFMYQNNPSDFTACSYPVPNKDNRGFIVHKISRGIYVSQGNNQKEVYDILLEARSKNLLFETPIWCDGYLPIRKIVVGPSSRQTEHLESIKHYCNNIFWLRDVIIEKSEIPYRKNFL